MPEIRHNLLNREWVIVATERATGPIYFRFMRLVGMINSSRQ